MVTSMYGFIGYLVTLLLAYGLGKQKGKQIAEPPPAVGYEEEEEDMSGYTRVKFTSPEGAYVDAEKERQRWKLHNKEKQLASQLRQIRKQQKGMS